MNGTEKVTQRMVGDETRKIGTGGQKAMILDFIVRVKGNHEKDSEEDEMYYFRRTLCLLCGWIARGKNRSWEPREQAPAVKQVREELDLLCW